jgi:hypothetical protein
MKADEAAEAIGQDREDDQFKRRAAVLIAFFAMLLAITGLGSNNAMKEAINHNIEASNVFAFFQAKNIRQTSLILGADQFELAWLNDKAITEDVRTRIAGKLADYRKTIARYESEPETGEGKRELLVKGRDHAAKRDRALKQDPYFDYAEVLLQITIVLISVSIVADQRWLTWIGVATGAIGALLSLNGFLLLVDVPGLG